MQNPILICGLQDYFSWSVAVPVRLLNGNRIAKLPKAFSQSSCPIHAHPPLPFLPTVEHFGLLLPKGRSHHTGVGEGGRSSAETGPGEWRDPEQAIPPRPSL